MARARHMQQGGADGGHACGEDSGSFGAIPQRKPLFQNFQVGVVQAAIDQADFLTRPVLAQAVGEFKESLALLGAGEDKG